MTFVNKPAEIRDSGSKALAEACLSRVPNSFLLIELASHRAKELAAGLSPSVPRDGSKDALLALRELSLPSFDLGALSQRAVASFQNYAFLLDEDSSS